MAKYYTFPTLFDEVLQISISDLKRMKYLAPNTIKYGKIQWSRSGSQTAEISILINTYDGFIEFDYNYNQMPVKYEIRLISLPSNIGKGNVWYFECPHTKKRCRKLYCVGGYFLHRTAFKGCMYDSQTKSKEARTQIKMIKAVFGTDDLYNQLYGKYFKRAYAGKPTKKCIKLREKIRRAESIPAHEVERVLLPKRYRY
jgi:hypothetical protein